MRGGWGIKLSYMLCPVTALLYFILLPRGSVSPITAPSSSPFEARKVSAQARHWDLAPALSLESLDVSRAAKECRGLLVHRLGT